jgi:Ca2+-binding RTX toxin-like protein
LSEIAEISGMTNHIQPLESRRHFAITLLVPNIGGVDTYFIAGDDNNDTATVFQTPAPLGSKYKYNFTCAEIPGSTRNAGDVQVYLYGGSDTIHLKDLPFGKASGGGGMDDVTLENCKGVYVTVYSPAESQAPPWDGADSFHLQSSTGCSIGGGDGYDTFDSSGNCNNSILYGDAGNDDFALGGPFRNSKVYGGDDNDILTGSGDWGGTFLYGGGGNDTFDCRGCYGGGITMYGGDDNDNLYGGQGDDTLVGGQGDDLLSGGIGDDLLDSVDGVAGNDVLSGGAHDKGDRARIDFDHELSMTGVESYTIGF